MPADKIIEFKAGFEKSYAATKVGSRGSVGSIWVEIERLLIFCSLICRCFSYIYDREMI